MLRFVTACFIWVVLIQADAVADECAPNLIGHNICEDVQNIATELSEVLPIEVSQNLNMIAIEADQTVLIITYQLTASSSKLVSDVRNSPYIAEWKKVVFQQLCQTDPMGALISLGGEVDLQYVDQNQSRIMNYTVSKLQCSIEGFPLETQKKSGFVGGPNPTYELHKLLRTDREFRSSRSSASLRYPTILETFGAAFRTENFIGSAMARERADWRIDPDFYPLTEDNLKGYEDYIDRFTYVNNSEENEALKRQIDREREDREIIQQSPDALATLAIFIAILLDWRGLAALLFLWLAISFLRGKINKRLVSNS